MGFQGSLGGSWADVLDVLGSGGEPQYRFSKFHPFKPDRSYILSILIHNLLMYDVHTYIGYVSKYAYLHICCW
jgi:hypothetical protein